MQSFRIHAFGGPDVLALDTLPRPEPRPGEMLIRVCAAGVNPIDYKLRKGCTVPADRLPIAPGRDVSGLVERCGAGVDRFRPCDEVYAMLPHDRGGYTEFVATPADGCAPKPRCLDHVHAAAVPLAALTAWQGLFDHGGLEAGQRVLIHGASGGVGHLATQFAAVSGATVFGSCAGEDTEFMRYIGAEKAIDYRAERFEDVVGEIDLVFDLIGGDTQNRSWAVLREGGTLVSTVEEPPRHVAAAHAARGIHYTARPDGAQLAEIGRLIDDGRVHVEVGRVFPLRQAANAQRALEQEHVRGKVVLKVA